MDAKTRARMNPTNLAIHDAAARQFAAEGKVTTAYLSRAVGLTPLKVGDRVNTLRKGGHFPWRITRVSLSGVPCKPRREGGRRDRDPVLVSREAMERDRAIWAERKRELWVEATEDMRDASGEVDDPREHGWLATPRSLPRDPGSSISNEMWRWVLEARRISRRLGIGPRAKRKAVAA